MTRPKEHVRVTRSEPNHRDSSSSTRTRWKSRYQRPIINRFDLHPDENAEEEDVDQVFTRERSIRFTRSAPIRRIPRPSYSISSESESNPSGIPEDEMGDVNRASFSSRCRKRSVFFAPYGGWTETGFSEREDGEILQAAWDGQVDLVRQLLENDPGGLVNRSDFLSPLHLACANSHLSMAEFLIQKGADLNAIDPIQKATPLMCAASGGSLPLINLLLKNGADVNAGFESGKTALHWAVEGGSPECTRKLLESGAKQNPPLIYTETPLHIAASLGSPECLKILLEFGADVCLCKGSERVTTLHIACEEGNSSCIRLLIKAGASLHAKNSLGQTPLHIAASADGDSTAILLSAGANPNARDVSGRSPLHSAISKGSRAVEVVRILLDYKADMNCQDEFGYTPLHLCALHETSQCASLLLSRGADVTAKNNAGITSLTLLVRKIPDVMHFLTERLDAAVCITSNDHDPADPDCEMKLDFRAIIPHSTDKRLSGQRYGSGEDKAKGFFEKPRKETDFLTCVLAVGYKKILAHPLSEAFLTLKWRRVRKFFWASLLFQVALVLLFTTYIINVYLIKCPMSVMALNSDRSKLVRRENGSRTLPSFGGLMMQKLSLSEDNDTDTIQVEGEELVEGRQSPFTWLGFTPAIPLESSPEIDDELTPDPDSEVIPNESNASDIETKWIQPPKEKKHKKVKKDTCELGTELSVVWCLLIIFAAILAVKELFQFMQSPASYATSSENWGQWALIGSVCVAAWPAASIPHVHLAYWQYPAAALGILLAWGLMLLQVGRFPSLGIYVMMLGKVAANFGLFISAYACLLIAFALAFCVLFPQHPSYSSLPLALLKVLTMMVGEVDYEDLFYGDNGSKQKNSVHTIAYPISAHLLHAAFVIIVSIVLMNLLVGLAVHDIQGLQKGAIINRLSRQTALISRLENFILSKKIQAVLPRKIGILLQKGALLVPSSYSWSYHFRPNDPRDKRLPKELKLAALRLASSNHQMHHSKHGGRGSIARRSSNQALNLRVIEEKMERIEERIEFLIGAFAAGQNKAKNENISNVEEIAGDEKTV